MTDHALSESERSLRKSALYIIDNLNLVTLALKLCDFKDVFVAVEAKHVRCLYPAYSTFADFCVERLEVGVVWKATHPHHVTILM